MPTQHHDTGGVSRAPACPLGLLSAAALITAAILAWPAPGTATPITIPFYVTATSGPLNGTIETGSFTYDSSSMVPGGGLNNNTGLLTALNFTWDGITYNQTTANTGSLGFDAAGLQSALFGNDCFAGGCQFATIPPASPKELWVVIYPTEFDYEIGATGATGTGTVTPGIPPTVPEPPTLTLLGAALAGLFLFRSQASRWDRRHHPYQPERA
jgi:hypothetical protein